MIVRLFLLLLVVGCSCFHVNASIPKVIVSKALFDLGISVSESYSKIYNSIIISADQLQNNGVEITSMRSSFELKNCLSQGLTSTLHGNSIVSGLAHDDLFANALNEDYNFKDMSPAFHKGDNRLY